MNLSAKRPSKADTARQRMLRDVTDGGSTMRRLNVEVEQSLFRWITMRAAEEDRSIADITRSLWNEYLSK